MAWPLLPGTIGHSVPLWPGNQSASLSATLATPVIQLQDGGLIEPNPYGAVSILYKPELSTWQMVHRGFGRGRPY